MIRGTSVRTGDYTMRYGRVSQRALLDCTSSRRSMVMRALPRLGVVTTEYQDDSSSKRPRVVRRLRGHVPLDGTSTACRVGPPGLRAHGAAPAAPLDPPPDTQRRRIGQPATPAKAKPVSKDRGLTRGHSISV